MEEIVFTFEKLEVYRISTTFVEKIYLISKTFPSEEQFGLTSQIRRASVSIASNIAEGSARMSQKDKAHFFGMAYGSLMEVVCQLDLANILGFVGQKAKSEIREDAQLLAKKLSALRRSHLDP
jgi:four helix bundle protein